MVMGDVLYCTGGVSDRFRPNNLVHCKDITEMNAPWQPVMPMLQSLSHHACVTLAIHAHEQSEQMPSHCVSVDTTHGVHYTRL
jgi:hypothetical protein